MEKINSLWKQAERYCQSKQYSKLRTTLEQMSEVASNISEEAFESLAYKRSLYHYISDCYSEFGHTKNELKYSMLAMELQLNLFEAVLDDTEEICSNTIQLRKKINSDDPCEDILEGAAALGSLEERIKEMVSNKRQGLNFDPVELTDAYLDIIDKVEEEVAQNLQQTRRGHGFCHLYWREKEAVLKKHGLEWRSPRVRNPRVRFD